VDAREAFTKPCCVLLSCDTEAQVHTQRYGRRPYGVGFLIAGYDVCIVALLLTTTWLLCHSRCTPLLPQKTGPHIFETCPSGNFFEYKAMAIGARSQACKTYLERTFEEYEAGTYKCLASLPPSLAQTHSLTHSLCLMHLSHEGGTAQARADCVARGHRLAVGGPFDQERLAWHRWRR